MVDLLCTRRAANYLLLSPLLRYHHIGLVIVRVPAALLLVLVQVCPSAHRLLPLITLLCCIYEFRWELGGLLAMIGLQVADIVRSAVL